MPKFTDWLKHSWDAFTSRDPTKEIKMDFGSSSYFKPDRIRLHRGNERSIVTAVYNRIAIDCAAIDIRHVKLDENGKYLEDINLHLTTYSLLKLISTKPVELFFKMR